MKKNDVVSALLPQIDAGSTAIIDGILSRIRCYPGRGIYLKYENTCTLTPSAKVVELYEQIRADALKSRDRKSSALVVDYGCGIGNVAVMLTSLIQNDQVLFPNLKGVRAIGIDKVAELLTAATYYINKATPLNNILPINLKDFILYPERFTAYTTILYRLLEIGANSNNFSIHFCARVFKDLELQAKLEEFILKNAAKGAYVVFPDGAVKLPRENAKILDVHTIKILK